MSDAQGKKHMHIECNHLVNGCGFTANAGTEEELLQKVAQHAAQDHGIAQVTPELLAKVKAAIQTR